MTAAIASSLRPNPMQTCCRLLIIGNPLEYHVGAHLHDAAGDLGWPCEVVDTRQAFSKNRWITRLYNRVLAKRPPKLADFGRTVIERCRFFRPEMILSTGAAPLSAATLQTIGKMGIRRANFLTDDPWNPKNAAGFFWHSLLHYDAVFTPRRANVADLNTLGCRRVEYLPFAYNPNYHFPEGAKDSAEQKEFAAQISIIGGADDDRIPLARACIGAGLRLALFGGYWDRWTDLRPFYRGLVHGEFLRKAVNGSEVNVCIVRRANRDGHAMRTFELPAMAGCMVVEDTGEHRELFGEEGDKVYYFQTPNELLDKTRHLLRNDLVRKHLKVRVHDFIERSGHTYADRLHAICKTFES